MPRLGLTPVAEALVQLVGADEAVAADVPSQALAWVAQTSVLPSLLALCAPRNPQPYLKGSASTLWGPSPSQQCTGEVLQHAPEYRRSNIVF